MTDASMTNLNKTIDKIGQAFDAFKEANDERIKALASGHDSHAAEVDQKLSRIGSEIEQLSGLKKTIEIQIKNDRERIEELEARASTPAKTPGEKMQKEYEGLFVDWIRHKGQSADLERQMSDLRRKMVELKTVTIASGAGGGVAVPEVIAREINRQELLFSPVRDLVNVVQTGTSDYKELVDLRGAAGGWIGESGDRSTPTATPTLRECAPTFGELYAYPQASEWSLDDIFFDVQQWLASNIAEVFAIAESTAIWSGNGSSQLTGIVNATPTAIADFGSPLRAAGAFQFVPCLTPSSPAVAEILPDNLLTLVYTLNSRYRAGATFAMNSLTTAAIRKLKDANNQYLWQPGLQAGQPDRLLGYPHATWEQMPDVGTNAFPVAFGNFKRAYTLADRVSMRITVDNVTNVGFVRFYIRRREGGIPTNNNALKLLKTTIA